MVLANLPVPAGAAVVLAGPMAVVEAVSVRPGPVAEAAAAVPGPPEVAVAAGPAEEVKKELYKQKPRMSVNAYRGFVFSPILG